MTTNPAQHHGIKDNHSRGRAAEPANHIAIFQEATIRRTWHGEEWWFAVSDVIAVLTDSADVRQYIKKMRSREPALDANWGTTCTPLVLRAQDGKMRETNCANTEGLFRIIQSIPSPKAEPFKRCKLGARLHSLGTTKLHTEAPDDTAGIAKALGNIARAKGMTQVARDAGLSRESLYRALSADGNPSFSTVLKVARALGVKLHAEAA